MTAFDSLLFKQELTKVGFPADQAEALAELTRDHVLGNAATKDDLLRVEQRLDQRIDRFEERLVARIDLLNQQLSARMEQLELRMLVRLGALVFAGFALASRRSNC